MIDIQVQEVLDLLNSELHGRVDYTLFSKIFDAVAVKIYMKHWRK